MNEFIRRGIEYGGLTSPVFGGCMFVDFGTVSLSLVFTRVKGIHGGKVGKVDGVIAVNRDVGRSDTLMREAVVMQIGQRCGQAMGPAQQSLSSLLLLKILEELRLLIEELS